MQTILRQKRFLIVDDFPDMRSVLRGLLQAIGVHDIDVAGSGSEALALLRKRRHNVVLCDYNLGVGKDGQQVLEEARDRRLIGLDSIFIMITAENARDMVMAAVEHVPDSYLTKPFTAELLCSRLDRLAEQKGELAPVSRALMANRYAAAIDELNTLLANDPKNQLELLKIKAEALLKSNNAGAAYAIYEEVLKERELRWAKIGIGKALMQKKAFAKAEEAFQEILASDSNAVHAYDELAQVQMAQGRFKDAEKTLSMAAELSPRGLTRQLLLADTALNNGNTDVAEIAFSRAVGLAKYSVKNHPSIHSGLAKSLIANGKNNEANEVAHQIKKHFSGHEDADFYRATATAMIRAQEGDAEGVAEAIAQAEAGLKDVTGRKESQMGLELVKVYSQLGEKDKANAMLASAIANNHDDDAFLTEIKQVCQVAGMGDAVEAQIREIQQRIVKVNNAGVRLIKKGEFIEALKLLREAADEMPGSKTINLNAAKATIMKMEQLGVTDSEVQLVRSFVTRVQAVAPDDWRLADILGRLKQLAMQN